MADIDKIYAALVAGRDNGQALETWITGANARDLVRDRQRTIAEGIDALERLKRELRDGRKHVDPPEDDKHTSCYCSAPTCSPPCSFCTDPANSDED